MNKYKFSELMPAAKMVAVQAYKDGWEETHDKDDLSWSECHSTCLDTDDEIFYTWNGEEINEDEN